MGTLVKRRVRSEIASFLYCVSPPIDPIIPVEWTHPPMCEMYWHRTYTATPTHTRFTCIVRTSLAYESRQHQPQLIEERKLLPSPGTRPDPGRPFVASGFDRATSITRDGNGCLSEYLLRGVDCNENAYRSRPSRRLRASAQRPCPKGGHWSSDVLPRDRGIGIRRCDDRCRCHNRTKLTSRDAGEADERLVSV